MHFVTALPVGGAPAPAGPRPPALAAARPWRQLLPTGGRAAKHCPGRGSARCLLVCSCCVETKPPWVADRGSRLPYSTTPCLIDCFHGFGLVGALDAVWVSEGATLVVPGRRRPGGKPAIWALRPQHPHHGDSQEVSGEGRGARGSRAQGQSTRGVRTRARPAGEAPLIAVESTGSGVSGVSGALRAEPRRTQRVRAATPPRPIPPAPGPITSRRACARRSQGLLALSFACLGVIYGDIGEGPRGDEGWG
jgi:hypothetical protein